MQVVAMFPWWVGVILAALSYVILHRFANQPTTSSVQLSQLGSMVTQTMWRTLAAVGQYAIPAVCLAGAGVSAWRRRTGKRLVGQVLHNDAAQLLDGMTWQQFERLVGESFRLQGYSVVETGGGGADGGVDLALKRNGETYLVQCKQWRAFRVGVDVVRELYGVMAAKGVSGGFVVTSGYFTEEARSFATGRNVKLIDGSLLRSLIKQASDSQIPRSSKRSLAASEQLTPEVTPPCPVCAQSMVRRTAKRGSAAGREFWGCSAYPRCKGTRPIG